MRTKNLLKDEMETQEELLGIHLNSIDWAFLRTKRNETFEVVSKIQHL